MNAEIAFLAACCYGGGATAVHGTDKLADMHIYLCPAPVTGMHSKGMRFLHEQKGIQGSGATESAADATGAVTLLFVPTRYCLQACRA